MNFGLGFTVLVEFDILLVEDADFSQGELCVDACTDVEKFEDILADFLFVDGVEHLE